MGWTAIELFIPGLTKSALAASIHSAKCRAIEWPMVHGEKVECIALNIKNEATLKLAKDLAELTGESMTAAVTEAVRERLDRIRAQQGTGQLPTCVAKTQYSLTDDPKVLGAPTGWTLRVTDALLSAGAGFVAVVTGNMMLMPGLPKVSPAASIDMDDAGRILNL
jgi:formate--tetrahydrofolate ligase